MSLDTRYRPVRFDDVLGQASTIQILRRFILTNKGRHQSYLFAGPWGSGKTTLGRILARALLCETPTPEGDPCDKCSSCTSILERGASMDFIEVDAATNSGKDEIQKITDAIQFDTFSGRQKLYLFDEAHQLSKQALDALLKPLEENVPGTQDKRLVCIFCTTEPEKMRATIFSRCAPAFVIQPVAPEIIGARLGEICKQEGIEADPDMLVVIAEMTECHIRDALKAVEGLSMLGQITKESVTRYLHLDQNEVFLSVLENVGQDLGVAMQAAQQLLTKVPPTTCYEKLAELSLLAYQVGLGYIKPPTHYEVERVTALGVKLGSRLLSYAAVFASRPGVPSASTLLCDLGTLHYGPTSPVYAPVAQVYAPTVQPVAVPFAEIPPVAVAVPVTEAPPLVKLSSRPAIPAAPVRATPQLPVLPDGRVEIPGEPEVRPYAKAVNDGKSRERVVSSPSSSGSMSLPEFAKTLGLQLREELRQVTGGPT